MHRLAGGLEVGVGEAAYGPVAPTVIADYYPVKVRGQVLALREKALLQLDGLKKNAGMNKALDAEVVYEVADAALLKRLQEYGVDLEDIVGCGFHSLTAAGETKVTAVDRREKYQACARSWKRRPDVGTDPAYPDLCASDAMAMKATGLWWLVSGDPTDRDGIYRMQRQLDAYHGLPNGMFSADEHIAGPDPSQGVELCAVVESMYSLENLIAHLEQR